MIPKYERDEELEAQIHNRVVQWVALASEPLSGSSWNYPNALIKNMQR